MKRHGRVLHFAVTGALLGGVGIGCASKHRGPYTNTGPDEELHVNPGPDEDPGAADGGAADGGAAEGGAADGGAAEGGAADGGAADGGPGEPLPDVNPGPIDEPSPKPTGPVIVNTAPQPQPQPEPPTLEPGTNNVRKVEDPARKRKR